MFANQCCTIRAQPRSLQQQRFSQIQENISPTNHSASPLYDMRAHNEREYPTLHLLSESADISRYNYPKVDRLSMVYLGKMEGILLERRCNVHIPLQEAVATPQ